MGYTYLYYRGPNEKCVYILIKKTDRSIQRLCRGWKDGIQMYLEQRGCKVMTYSQLVVETIQWHELVNKVRYLGSHPRRGIS